MRNITRERGWRPLWEKDLKNILDAWTMGQLRVDYRDGNRIHKYVYVLIHSILLYLFCRELGTWLWAKVVQTRLDRARERQKVHRIRIQRRIFLPSGGTSYEFYHSPRKFHGTNMLIKVPDMSIIDDLLQEFAADEHLCFGDKTAIALFEALFIEVGSPKLSLRNTWAVWRRMMDLLDIYLAKSS